MKVNFAFNKRPPRVAILGGGATGMAAAWELARSGAEVVLLEREDRVGGLCATYEREGWRFDLGGHRFISRSGELVERVSELLGEELLERQRRSVILHRGRRYRYPLDAVDLAEKMEVLEGMRAVASFARARLERRGAEERTFEEWVVARFGRYLYGRFFGPYTEKLWGIPPSRLSSDWAAERIAGLDLGDAILRLLALRRGRRPRSHARGYYYPRLGIGQIFEAIAAEIGPLGAKVELSATVEGLERDRAGAVRAVRWRGADGEERAVECDFVISTVSLPLVARWVAGGDGEVRRHGEALKYRAVRFLNLMIDRAEVTPNTWMYVSEPRYLATRIQEPRHRSPEMAPVGKTSLMLEIPCDVGDEVWRASDGALTERCVGDLEGLGVAGIGGDLRGVFSTFVAEGYPIYALGYEEHQRALLAAVGRAGNLVSCGRQGTFRYIFMDIAMEMGIQAARQVLAGRGMRQGEITRFRSDRELIEAQSVTA